MMIHPAAAHFAVVLPLVATVFGLIYLFTKTEGMSKISSRITVFAALGVVAAWYTGGQVAGDVYPLLVDAGQHELKEHKALGLYLAIAMGIIAVLKFVGCRFKIYILEVVAVVMLVATSGVMMKQAQEGGEVVYKYGGGVEGYSDGMDCIEEMAEMEDEEE
jgi:uncharacterized membrane protein